jgi:hypothetical protein
MENFRFFDYQALSEQFNINPKIVAQFVKEAQAEFPGDAMMIELHVVRALNWFKNQNKTNLQ